MFAGCGGCLTSAARSRDSAPGIPHEPIGLETRRWSDFVGVRGGDGNLTDRPMILTRSALPAVTCFDWSPRCLGRPVLGPFEYRYLLERPAPHAPGQ